MKNVLVSVIVTTKNNHETLNSCLQSIKQQSYKNIELIVVDNYSTDDTKEIANKYTTHVFTKGPERSAQRNYAVQKSSGVYVLIIDSDMELGKEVVKECVQIIESDPGTKAVIIPERSFGRGFWAQCKQLERSFYVGVTWMEAARFIEKKLYKSLGGYNEKFISGEDWDLSQRIAKQTNIAHTHALILHNEGKLRLTRTLKKKYYYASQFNHYYAASKDSKALKYQTSILSRYKLFFSHPIKLFRNPVIGLGMLFMKTCEFSIGVIGLLYNQFDHRKHANFQVVTQDKLLNSDLKK